MPKRSRMNSRISSLDSSSSAASSSALRSSLLRQTKPNPTWDERVAIQPESRRPAQPLTAASTRPAVQSTHPTGGSRPTLRTRRLKWQRIGRHVRCIGRFASTSASAGSQRQTELRTYPAALHRLRSTSRPASGGSPGRWWPRTCRRRASTGRSRGRRALPGMGRCRPRYPAAPRDCTSAPRDPALPKSVPVLASMLQQSTSHRAIPARGCAARTSSGIMLAVDLVPQAGAEQRPGPADRTARRERVPCGASRPSSPGE
jgi:hypothetical protein